MRLFVAVQPPEPVLHHLDLALRTVATGVDTGDRSSPVRWTEVENRHLTAAFFGDVAEYLVVTLEYGKDHDRLDPFDISARRIAQSDSENALDGSYLHPVVRHHRAEAQVGEQQITENLENEWTEETVHRAPLFAFLETALGGVRG